MNIKYINKININMNHVYQQSNHYNNISLFINKRVRWNKNYLLSILDNHLIHYPAPVNLSYAWSFGSTASVVQSQADLIGVGHAVRNHWILANSGVLAAAS